MLISRGHAEHAVFWEYSLDKVDMMYRAAVENQVHEGYMLAAAYHAPKKLKDFLPAGTAARESTVNPNAAKRLARLARGRR